MNRGEWYLMYSYDVLYGDEMSSPRERKVSLEATTQSAAIAEAKTKWENLTTFKGEEEKPYYPYVVYKIPL